MQQDLNRHLELQSNILKDYNSNAKSKFIYINESKLNTHYLESGTGEELLMIHGGFDIAMQFSPLFNELEQHFHLFVPDRPGFGLTDQFNYQNIDIIEHAKNFVKHFLDELNIEKIHLLGNSMGGFWCFVFALAYPERVKSIILLGGPYGIDKQLPLFLRLMATPVINKLIFATAAKPKKLGTKTMYKHMGIDPEVISDDYSEYEYLCQILPGSSTSWKSIAENAINFNGTNPKYLIPDKLKEIKHNTLFIHGDKDDAVSLSSAQKVSSTMENARVEIIEDGSHLPWFNNPDKCTELIIDFLK